MTLFYPDISGYEAGISLSGMSAVVVKATEGTTYTNPDYARVARDATSRGIPWAAYHFLHHNSSPSAQAQFFHSVAGNAPCMLDVETAGDGSKATVQDCLDFTNELVTFGGRVRLAYLPHWYWQALGSPSLVPLAVAGIALVSSQYTTYSDTGPGWASYGGVAPTVWQYTDAHSLNGFTVDYNAYRGSVDEFRALLNGGVSYSMSDSQNITDLHDRSNWMVTPATSLTPTTAGHPLPGSMTDRLAAFAQDPKGFLAPAIADVLAQAQTNGAGISELKALISSPTPVTVDAAAVAAALVASPGFADQVAEAVVGKLAARMQS